MKRDLDQVLMNAYGKPFEPTMALGVACFQALNSAIDSDQRLTAEDKLKMYRVGKKIAIGGIVDFSPEEIVLIKERVGKLYGAMAMGAICEILDADYVEPPA
jgi:hypothetical protein